MLKYIWTGCLLLLTFCPAFAQNYLTVKVIDSVSTEALPGASVSIKNTDTGAMTDAEGIVQLRFQTEEITLICSFIGYKPYSKLLSSATLQDTVYLRLTPLAESMEEVIVSATRSSRTIDDIPTRVEVLGEEELAEKANMKPGDIRMLLNESTGIQTQITSATSGNSAIRIQGLDGRYTQILKDGFPLFGGAASGLGLLQIPPLDLKRVEVIKGSASTLYGGGAIAGLVNLVSKTPEEERELTFHINGTSGGGLDVNGYFGQKFGKIGTTIFASHNRNAAYAPSGETFSAIPKFERFTFNPKLYIYPSEKTSISIGLNSSFEDRLGGDVEYIDRTDDPGRTYFEQNKTKRLSTLLNATHLIGANGQLQLKSSFSYFDRTLKSPDYIFQGVQKSTFTELSYAAAGEIAEWVFGTNLYSDNFEEAAISAQVPRDYQQLSGGLFIQNTLSLNPKLSLESGIRSDYVKDYGWALLPRVSALYKFNSKWSSRLGGGFGYKTPNVFSEESERLQFRRVLPIDATKNSLERSYGANWDFNFKTSFGDDFTFSVNHLFFYTYINDPLLLERNVDQSYQFNNIDGFMDSKGTETNVKLTYQDFKLFLGYTFTDAHTHNNGQRQSNLLTPKNRINAVLFYEQDEKWKIGLEGYYFSKQRLADGSGRPYWINGLMIERLWERFSLYVNFENFLDARQTRFDTIYTGTIQQPQFRDIYAPLDGFVVNGGIKFRL